MDPYWHVFDDCCHSCHYPTAGLVRHSVLVTLAAADKRTPISRIHWAWVVAAVSFVAILGAAGFRSVPGVMMTPLHHEFGWSHGVVGLAMSVNMTLFGLTAPFAAALMDRFGVRPVLSVALTLIAAGSALSVFMTTSWQLVLLWGVLVGVGTGSISMGFVATVATRWFEARRGLVTGVLTAASATGQLIFLPIVAQVTEHHGWRWASLIVAAAALAVVPLVAGVHAQLPAGQGLDRLRRHRSRPSPPRYPRPASAPRSTGCCSARRCPRSGCWPPASRSAA